MQVTDLTQPADTGTGNYVLQVNAASPTRLATLADVLGEAVRG